jgi:hypothetical protein
MKRRREFISVWEDVGAYLRDEEKEGASLVWEDVGAYLRGCIAPMV